jgi:hypothetical protein
MAIRRSLRRLAGSQPRGRAEARSRRIPLRRPRPLAGLAVLASLLAPGCAARMELHEHGRHHGFSSDVATVQMVSALVGGKNLFIPSTVVVTDGGPRSLSLYNATEMPHGFKIEGLGIETVLPPGEEVVINLPALQGGQVLRITCHLHPPHRGATLVVLPSE